MINIEEANDRLDAFMLNNRGISKASSNNASQIGHPCARFLYYRRHPDHYDKCKPFSLGTLYRFWGGSVAETDVVRLLMDAGFQVTETQKSVYYPDFQVAGKIDGFIGFNGSKSLMEIKSMQPFIWDKIDKGSDFLEFDDSKWFYRQYFDQVNWYLLMEGIEHGVFVLLNKATSRLKLIGTDIDINRADEISKKLTLVNTCLNNNITPDPISNVDVCSMCQYFGHCAPPMDFSGEYTPSSELPVDLPEKLYIYRRLKPIAKEFTALDKELSRELEGIKAIVGDVIISGSWIKKRNYDIPDGVKVQYETESTEYWKKKITWPKEEQEV